MSDKYQHCVVKVIRPTDSGSGLGIFCNYREFDAILTCAHLLLGMKEPTQDDPACLSINTTDKNEFMFNSYAMTADFCLDVLSLGEIDLGIKLENPTPWDKSKYTKSLRENSPLPHKIVFLKPWDELRSTIIEGYYYDNDGVTKIVCDIIIQRDSFILELESDVYMKAGCSGGPIFTKDHRLIGVVTNLNRGARLDITLPPIILDMFCTLPELEINDRGKMKKETPPDGWN